MLCKYAYVNIVILALAEMSEPNSIESWPEPTESLMNESNATGTGGASADFDDSGDFIEAVRGLYGEPPAGPRTSTQTTSRTTQGK